MKKIVFPILLMMVLLLSLLPTSVAAATNGYLVDNGVLISYSGNATNIVIPKGVTTIGEEAFNCTNRNKITSITMPDSVTTIEASAFAQLKSLTKLTLSKNLKSIGDSAFFGCSKIKTIKLSYGLKRIEYEAFGECTSLTNMAIPATVTYIGENSVYSWSKKQEFVILGDGILYKYNGKGGNVVIPNNVKIIGECAFAYNPTSTDAVKSVTIPGSVKEIWDAAFNGCSNLTSVKLAEGIKSISPGAFSNCPKMTKINIPKSLDDTSLVSFRSKVRLDKQSEEFDIRGNGVLFKYNGTDANVVIPEEVKIIGLNAFYQNSTMESVVIPDSVVSIGPAAFMACIHLEQVDIPDSVKSIGDYAFEGCYHLSTVQLPKGLTCIADSTFSSCVSLERFNIPDTVSNIGVAAFSNCMSLAEVLIPKSVTRIERATFDNCLMLDGVFIPSSVNYIGKEAFGSTISLTDITIQNGNARVDENAFHDFDKRQKVTITTPAGGAVQRMAARQKIPFRAYTKQMDPPAAFSRVQATPIDDKVPVNDLQTNVGMYMIDYTSYCKLNDLAAALTGTNKQFAVSRDTALNAVRLT
jgi:hypothetical protein